MSAHAHGVKYLLINAWVKSKRAHPPPPRANPRAFDKFLNYVVNPRGRG